MFVYDNETFIQYLSKSSSKIYIFDLLIFIIKYKYLPPASEINYKHFEQWDHQSLISLGCCQPDNDLRRLFLDYLSSSSIDTHFANFQGNFIAAQSNSTTLETAHFTWLRTLNHWNVLALALLCAIFLVWVFFPLWIFIQTFRINLVKFYNPNIKSGRLCWKCKLIWREPTLFLRWGPDLSTFGCLTKLHFFFLTGFASLLLGSLLGVLCLDAVAYVLL